MFISPTNEYPRYIGDVQLEHPNWEYGDPLPEGWTEVEYSDYPSAGEYEVVFEDFPVEVDGKMKQNWQIRPMTAEEKERKDAPKKAREKLIALGLTELEIDSLVKGFPR